MQPRYLGDGVYATFDGYHIWVKTGSHDDHECTNNIALEPDVFAALMAYGRDLQGELEQKQKEETSAGTE
jgi:hypothetical protein